MQDEILIWFMCYILNKYIEFDIPLYALCVASKKF